MNPPAANPISSVSDTARWVALYRAMESDRPDALFRDPYARRLAGAAGAAAERPQLVENAVLRHLEQPGREPRAQREAREPLEDAEEDFLRQVLRERAIPGESKDVVVDRLLVRSNDDRERALVAALGLAQDSEIGLWQRHGAASIEGHP